MNENFWIAAVLLAVFLGGGALLILSGLLVLRRLTDSGSVEVEAECVSLGAHTETIGTGMDRTYFYNAKRPVYRYRYEGVRYTSSPMLASNRRGYAPELGRCTIRINPKKPEKVYSPERRFVALILIFIGALWIAVAIFALLLLKALL